MMQGGAAEAPPSYQLSFERGLAFTGVCFAETLQQFSWAHLPEPFDIVNNVGNMGPSVPLAMAGCMLYAYHHPEVRPADFQLSAEKMSNFRKFGIAAVCAGVALVNCITETKWGIQHVPVIGELAGTPDPLDIVYGTAMGAFTSLFVWRKKAGQPPKSS